VAPLTILVEKRACMKAGEAVDPQAMAPVQGALAATEKRAAEATRFVQFIGQELITAPARRR
jgi:hypothetical protein